MFGRPASSFLTCLTFEPCDATYLKAFAIDKYQPECRVQQSGQRWEGGTTLSRTCTYRKFDHGFYRVRHIGGNRDLFR